MSEKTLELKPCPFCGDKAALNILEDEPGEILTAWVSCMCGTSIGESLSEETAIKRWNTRSSSPAQEPVTTEPIGQDGPCFYCGEVTSCFAGNPGMWPLRFSQPDGTGITHIHHTRCVTDRLAIPAPPQPGREDSELEELVARAIWEECCRGMKWGQIDHLIYCRMAGAAIARMRALTGEPK